MTRMSRDDANLRKLRNLAKINLDERRRHLADLEAAHASAEASLDWLKQCARAEEQKAAEFGCNNFHVIQGFTAGVRAKQIAITATMEMLVSEINEACEELRAAHIELQKLEHLVGVRQKAARKVAAKKDAALISEYAIRSAR